MNIAILYPFIYLFLGIFISKSGLDDKWNVRWYTSSLLTRIFIPFIIIYNIAYHQSGVFTIMIAIILITAIMLFIGFKLYKDIIISLCFSYLNMGWLGLPLTIALYGDQGAMVMIAAYVGSSIFGNSVGAGLFVQDQGFKQRLLKIFSSSSLVSFIVGLIIFPFALSYQHWFLFPYVIAKFGMSFLGMLILGIWIGKSKPAEYNFIREIKLTINRFILFGFCISFLVGIGFYFKVDLITNNLKTLYLMGLLPPAANIVVLETYYLQTGRSASIIATGTIVSIIMILIYGAITNLV